MDAQMQKTDERSSLLDDIVGLFVGSAHAQETKTWTDQFSFTLEPGEGVEWKLVMEEGQVRSGGDGGRSGTAD